LFYSGGTEVTVTGHQLNSVTTSQINLTVIITNDTSNSVTSNSNFKVLWLLLG